MHSFNIIKTIKTKFISWDCKNKLCWYTLL